MLEPAWGGWIEGRTRPNRTGLMTASLPYRPCVGIMMVNRDGRVFVGQRIDSKEGDAWQMPQGGIDPGEEAEEAALRELGEETGVEPKHIQVLAHTKDELFYDLPPELAGRIWGGKYRGQRQVWFLARFLGEDSDIDIATAHPEFDRWRWADPDTLVDLIVPFKKKIYRAVVAEFRDLI
jgi:putative (di)nucleoside polyphosphate hydrolase